MNILKNNVFRFSVAFIIFLGCFAITELWSWIITFLSIGTVVAIAEIISIKKDNKSLSQRFWETNKRNKTIGISSLVAFVIYLILHLLFKI